MRAIALATTIASLALSLSVFTGGVKAAEGSVCGTVVREDLTLTDDLDCGLRIEGDGITVDLAGHTVRGSVLIHDSDDVTLRGGTVIAPGSGIVIYIGGLRGLLEEVTVSGGTSWAVEAGGHTTIRRSVFHGNSGVAADQYYGSYLLVEGSTFTGNGTGVSIQSGSGAIIRGNQFTGNGVGVRVWDEDHYGADGTSVLNNKFDSNRIGVYVNAMAGASDTVISRNIIKNSGASGVLVRSQGLESWPDNQPGGGLRTVIQDNTITGSGSSPMPVGGCTVDDEDFYGETCFTTADDGITVLAPPEIAGTITVARNRSMNNAGYGIEAPNVIDGERNVAKKNSEGACVGVACF